MPWTIKRRFRIEDWFVWQGKGLDPLPPPIQKNGEQGP